MSATIDCAAVLFDMDGVLVDTRASVERSWRQWALRHGLDPAEVLRAVHGRPSVATIRDFLPHADVAAEGEAINAFQARDGDGVVAGAGVRELLPQLPADRWAVVTSATRELALARFEQAGLPAPETLVSLDDVVTGKPDPACYLLGARRLDIVPARCVVFEDAPVGIDAARAAAMQVVGITTTHAADDLRAATHVRADLRGIAVRATGDTMQLVLGR